jgi:precorrin-3B synthase
MSGRTEGGNVERPPFSQLPEPEILLLTDSRFAISIALPFGHIRAETLTAFVAEAAGLDAAEIRLAPRRALLLLCPSRAAAEAVHDVARTAGFIVDAADPRRSIAACPGSPSCASGHISARAMAAEIAASMPRDLALNLHISGCAKRCAKPGHDGLTLLGLPDGAGLVLEGLGDQPIAHVAKEGAAAAIGRVAALIRTEKTPGEDTAACARRLGVARLAQEFRQAS